eukprot:CAMPEP_0171100234 /NCGR_PEP_ID=MMETSP0766_2-20121228/52838_1 /TAXON_ID=439317 /ORGANISM="Gambierdiscus australes, Strain CAWD 149" /LENGTH=134 /DNA_ID=CAMNT_0011560025 /DNA_START=80 /DNA_END=484 /DNA_ORIENTATION=+
MLPYFLILPLWLAIAIALPLTQSLHALQQGSLKLKRTWLCYWLCFVAASWILYYFEWLISIPFYVLSFYLDIYYEVQLLLVFYLVCPKFMGIAEIEKAFDTNAGKIGPIVSKHSQAVGTIVKEKATSFCNMCFQ